jgi:biopolymer transport protein ExbB/TolQ
MNQTDNLLKRTFTFIVAIVAAIVVIGLIKALTGPTLQEILLDSDAGFWPFTVQNIMWVALFIGFGELVLRWSAAKDEESQLKRGYLPTDGRSLDMGVLGKIRDSIASRKFTRNAFLPRLISRTIDQYRMSGQKDQALGVMNASLELYMHEIDLRYSILRYLTWLIPSLGFIGTVMGIMFALQYAGVPANAEADDFLYQVTQRLGVAFTTTLLALIMSAVLVLIQSMVQSKEERALNAAGQYTIDNLILRLGDETPPAPATLREAAE